MHQAKPRWVFVDDSEEAAKAFAQALSEGDAPIQVELVKPVDARATLLTNRNLPVGVLMDVDLSNDPGLLSTGPGIAQDIRVKQRKGELGDYPIVRFAGLENVRRNIGGDPTSDDLFDWKVMKEEVPRSGAPYIWAHLEGIRAVYGALSTFGKRAAREGLPRLLGLDQSEWERFGHPAFADRLVASAGVATHVAAGVFLRSFLTVPGLLIDERLLAVRLGVDTEKCEAAWRLVVQSLSFRYKGVAEAGFARWWARGLDEWWTDTIDRSCPLSSLTAEQRIQGLERIGFKGLAAIEMPKGSAGNRPWRFCCLSLEEYPPVFLPLDPAESIRLTSTTDFPPWVDPKYAALGPALQAKGDARLNDSDLKRLQLKHKQAV